MNRSLPLPWRKLLFGLALVVVSALLIMAPATFAQDAEPDAAPIDGLTPGKHVTYTQRVPINLVFIGYEQGDFKMADLKSVLPNSYKPVVRYPQFYGLAGRDLGLKFNFQYQVKYAGPGFESDFFNYLAGIAKPGPMTPGMAYYNNQQKNVRDITDPVWYIDAPSTEQWLMTNAGRLGVNTARGYTIFFVNWFNRPDFNFHLYTNANFIDPDTGYNHGANDWYRVTTAWGGSHGRTWFYDLSAGPEDWSFTENVDNPDLDGDGVEEYRMPPIWEYSPDGYRDPAALGGDLGRVSRYIAINLLFTSSPLYDPLVSSPAPAGQKVVNNEIFELDRRRGIDGTDFYSEAYATSRLDALQPYYGWDAGTGLHKPPDAGASRALRIFSGNALTGGCWRLFGTPFAQLFCYFNANYDRYVPDYDPPDYVVPVFSYHTTDRQLGNQWGLLGFADDDWVSGTPSYVFVFDTPTYQQLGFGFSAVTVHEVGHHIGMSHPHDGWDSEQRIDYGPAGPFFFAWQGDYSATTMSYMWVNDGFGKFDHDNMNRYQFAGLLNWANEILADIVAHPDADTVQDHVDAAEAAAIAAQKAFNRWDYAAAADHAQNAWEEIALAADALDIDTSLNVPVLRITPPGAPPKEGDRLKGPFVK